MTISDLINNGGLDRTDAELLIAYVLGKPRSFVIAHGNEEIDSARLELLRTKIERRRSGEPLAYITGSKEFYGRDFLITRDTLVPRPATEALITDSLQFLQGKTPITHEIDSEISAYSCRFQGTPVEAVLDIGTGSGCIAITLALEGVTLPIIAVDTSDSALRIAIKNAKNLGAQTVQFTRADGTNVVRNFHRPFLIVSNPPYIPKETILEKTVHDFEPHKALFAGSDGLDVIRPLLMAARGNANCVGVVVEMRTEQVRASVEICDMLSS